MSLEFANCVFKKNAMANILLHLVFSHSAKSQKKSHMLFCNGSAANNMQKHFRINKGGGGGGGKGCLIFFPVLQTAVYFSCDKDYGIEMEINLQGY